MFFNQPSKLYNDKLEQATILYGLVNPFTETIDAHNHIMHLEKKATKQTDDEALKLLYIFSSILKIDNSLNRLKKIQDDFINYDIETQIPATLICSASPYETDSATALSLVTEQNNILKQQGIKKNLRMLTLIASLYEPDAEQVCLSKTLLDIQKLFNLSKNQTNQK